MSTEWEFPGEGITEIVFDPWPKTPRMVRNVVVTEKIDGTNGAICVAKVAGRTYFPNHMREMEKLIEQGATLVGPLGDEIAVWAQSRNRVLTPGKDNAGFGRWVSDNARALAHKLGPGHHFGEWWGAGIQRGYGGVSKRFSLFNTGRWPAQFHTDTHIDGLDVVPIIAQREWYGGIVDDSLSLLQTEGSLAAPGFMRPEGVILYHTGSRQQYKAFVDDSEKDAERG